jgi:DNA-binding IclR family transcriptional regulator
VGACREALGADMTPLPAALVSAARSLPRSFVVVLLELHDSLDDAEFRKAPVAVVADRLRITEQYVYEALRELERLGYLEQGEKCGNARTYRLAVAA